MTSRLAQAMAGALIALSAAACGLRAASAQGPAGDHGQHHPGGAPSASPAVPQAATPPAMPSPAAEMGGRRPGPLMPALMDADRLSESEREALREAAERQVEHGLGLLEHASRELSDARRRGDQAALERAAEKLREGLALWETGTAARRALSLPPAQGREAAVRWFKGQMNLEAAPDSAQPRAPWGFSWMHLGAMATLIALVLGGVALYVYKVRRALATLDRLTRDGPSP